jgi:hypothetical protein
MRILALLLILLLSISFASATTSQYATIKVVIINRPPEISTISISPNEAYYDSTLTCNATIDDELPDKVTLNYNWYKNNKLLQEKSKTLTGVNENDVIKCEATPTDVEGAIGKTKSAETTILKSPVRVKLVKPILSAVGIQVSVKDLKEGTSISAVTGMVTGYRKNSSITLIFLLGIFALILIGLNLFGFVMAFKRKKVKSPTRD